MDEVILQVDRLKTEFKTEDNTVMVLDGVTFQVKAGKTLGIVGESGCGKSVTALSIMGLLPHPQAEVISGSIVYRGEDLVAMSPLSRYALRGNRISMIFQDPMTSLNPVHTIGQQIREVLELHQKTLSRQEQTQAILDMLDKVGIPSAEQIIQSYPHQLSGGMRQRVMIAMALACRPDVLICDEPTTALDVTVQAQILSLMKELQQETGMAIIFITHDLGVIAEMCDEVVVMYAGRTVECADVMRLFDHAIHPYTQGLLRAMSSFQLGAKQRLETIEGTVPSLSDMPEGCRFHPRCPHKTEKCEVELPKNTWIKETHLVQCHHWKRGYCL